MSTNVKRRNGGYFTIPNRWIDAGYMEAAPGSVTQVYLHLSRWADNGTLQSSQPMRLIAKKSGLSEDVARKAVRVLEAWGVLDRDPGSGRHAKNIWMLNDLPDRAPEYPDKVPPIQSGGPDKVGVQQSGGPYQPDQDQPNSSDQPDVNTYTPEPETSVESTPKARVTYPADFEQFWSSFPSGKGNKKKSYDQWKRIKPDDVLFREIMDSLQQWNSCGQWQRGFVTHAERCLRDRFWENEPPHDPEPARASPNAPGKGSGRNGGYTVAELYAMTREDTR